MSFNCNNGTPHRHETVHESKVCWGLISLPVPPSRPKPVVPPVRVEMATVPQKEYVNLIGGDVAHAATLTKVQCIKYIDQLKAAGYRPTRGGPVTDTRLD